MSGLIQARDRLEAVILGCERLLEEDTSGCFQVEEIISIARKVTPATIPPAGLRYAFDVGPVEALLSRCASL